MDDFLTLKRNFLAALRWGAARIISIMVFAFGLAVLGAEAQTNPAALDVSSLSFGDNKYLTLTCDENGAWYYKYEDSQTDSIRFSGTLTGTQTEGKEFFIKSYKTVTPEDESTYATLNLDGLRYKSDGSVFSVWRDTQPVYIKTIGSNPSVLESIGVADAIGNFGTLVLDGGTAGLTVRKEAGSNYSIICLYLDNNSNTTLKGYITLMAYNSNGGSAESYALRVGSTSKLDCASATILFAGNSENTVIDASGSFPILGWCYDTAPAAGQTLKIKKEANEAEDTLTFTTDGKMRSFATIVPVGNMYSLRLDGILQKASPKDVGGVKTTFSTSENGLKTYIKTQNYTVKDWIDYGGTADVGSNGTDVTLSAVSDRRTYTVKTARGLAWIASVVHHGFTTAKTGFLHSAYYPVEAGFSDCDIILANDISLAKPTGGDIKDNFSDNWYAIGEKSSSRFKGSFYGNGHTVSDLKTTTTDIYNSAGLFGYIENGLVKDLRVEGSIDLKSSSMEGNYSIGGIAGSLTNSSIIGCSSAVAITVASEDDKTSYVGGIAGECSGNMNILNCWNEGKIDVKTSGLIYAGGIVGELTGASGTYKAVISNCYATAAVESSATGQFKACQSGGIIGGISTYNDVVISNCYVTGTISATSKEWVATAGGIAGGIVSVDTATITRCLALNVGPGEAAGISATSGYNVNIGRVFGAVGGESSVTLSDNYASTRVTLSKKVGETPATPALALGTDQKDGADLYLDEAPDAISSWAGDASDKAFTALGTDTEGTLPRLKTITAYDADGQPSAYGEAIAGQPAASLKSADYLGMPPALDLSKLSATGSILISRSGGKWLYRIGDDATAPTIRFNGTISGQAAEGSDTYGIVITRSVNDSPTLTLADGTRISSNQKYRAALSVEENATLTIEIKGTVHIVSTENDGGIGFYNLGELTLKGDESAYLAVDCKPQSDDRSTTALTNANKLSVESYSGKILLSAKAVSLGLNEVIDNTSRSTFSGGGWLEWQAETPMGTVTLKGNDDSSVEYAVPSDANAFAVLVKDTDKSYTLLKGETLQKGFTWLDDTHSPDNLPVKTFTPKKDARVVYVYVSDLETIEIAGASDYSTSNCATNAVTVKPAGILTVDAPDAALVDLTIELGGQVVLTNPLQVTGDFKTSRTLDNKWIAFGSPIALTAEVADDKLLYTATGYKSAAAADQRWQEISGPSGTTTADFAAAVPYLLSAEDADTPLDLTASGHPDVITFEADPVESLGESLGNGVFRFKTNRTLQNQTLSGIYVLDAAGTQFGLHYGEYIVKPFEAFIVANAVTRASTRSLAVGEGLPTGIEPAVLNEGIRVWGARGVLHVYTDRAADVTVVSLSGAVLRRFEAPAGDTATSLPAGVYLVRCGNVTYKIVL